MFYGIKSSVIVIKSESWEEMDMQRIGRYGFYGLILGILLCLPIVGIPGHSNMGEDLVVDSNSYVVEHMRRVGNTMYEYVFKADVVNSSVNPYSNVSASLISGGPGTTIINRWLSFGTVGAGESVTSTNTFIIRRDVTVPFDPDALVWAVNGDEVIPAEVNSVSSVAGYEGDDLVHTIALTTPVGEATVFSLDISDNTAQGGVDYDSANLAFSHGVTHDASAGTIQVPAGVSVFTVTVPTIEDGAGEPRETYDLHVGGVDAVGTILDDDVTTVALTKEQLGEQLFFEKNLSFNRTMSCATCHDPDYAFIDPRFRDGGKEQRIFVHGALSVGADGISLGGANAPTVTYAQKVPEGLGTESVSIGGGHYRDVYTGGMFWDGRAADLQEQAGGPPLDHMEMMMPSRAAVVDRIRENPAYVAAFTALYGGAILDNDDAAYNAMTQAIASYENTEEFAPFDSKWDRHLAGEYSTTDLESKGKRVFFDRWQDCKFCHGTRNTSQSAKAPHHVFSRFFHYDTTRVPRNKEAMDARAALGLQAPDAIFQGLGGVLRDRGIQGWEKSQGLVRVQNLRNVAVTGPYMHMGQFRTLRTVVHFYGRRIRGRGGHGSDFLFHNHETGKPWQFPDLTTGINIFRSANMMLTTADRQRKVEAFLRMLTDQRYESLLSPLAPEGYIGND